MSRRPRVLALSVVSLLTIPGVAGLARAAQGGGVAEVGCIGLTVSDLERASEFYGRVLDFQRDAEAEVDGEPWERLEGVFGLRARIVRLRLGRECLELTEYLAPRGRPVPVEARANDRSFQHVAIVVSDMDAAYRRLRSARVEHASSGISTGLVAVDQPRLGLSRAVLVRDPDGHAVRLDGSATKQARRAP